MPSPLFRHVLILAVVLPLHAHGQDEPVTASDDSIPSALAPFEHIIGAWKGQGIPTANKLRGWPERHLWAWAFSDGKPVGLTIELEGSKLLKKGRLTHDAKADTYRLTGTDAEGKDVAYSGSLDEKRQNLTLERETPLADGATQRLVLRLNSNQIRYLIWDERRPRGGSRFARSTEMQMGKEGESFAAGGAAANLPKCVITGGAATLTVTYNGTSYPVCCTGCRDEFEADPQRWLKKIAARGGAATAPAAPTSSPTSEEADTPKNETPRDTPKAPQADKAADLLKRAADLEKSGKTQAALTYYRMVVKDHAGTPQARQAAERIEALGKK